MLLTKAAGFSHDGDGGGARTRRATFEVRLSSPLGIRTPGEAGERRCAHGLDQRGALSKSAIGDGFRVPLSFCRISIGRLGIRAEIDDCEIMLGRGLWKARWEKTNNIRHYLSFFFFWRRLSGSLRSRWIENGRALASRPDAGGARGSCEPPRRNPGGGKPGVLGGLPPRRGIVIMSNNYLFGKEIVSLSTTTENDLQDCVCAHRQRRVLQEAIV